MPLDLQGVIEVSRRFVTLVLFCVSVVAVFGYGWLGVATASGCTAIATYLLPPRPKPPEGALHHDRLPSVWMPDLLGFLLATTFLATPFIVSALEEWPGVPWGLILFMWPPGLVALAILWFSSLYQCFWVLPERSAITLNTIWGRIALPYSEIVRVSTETRRPPGWLSPLLILFGGWRGLGIALLHGNRADHSLVLERIDGERIRLPLDAFPDAAKVIKALGRAGLTVARESAHGGRIDKAQKPRRSRDDAELA